MKPVKQFKAAKRITQEIGRYVDDPPEFAPKIAICGDHVTPIYFLMVGPPETPYENGEYVVRFDLPPNYPLSPPKIAVLTPSGRFVPGKEICTTFTHYHPELWSPINTLSTLMMALVSFMTEDTKGIGSIVATEDERRKLAAESRAYNTLMGYDRIFADFQAASDRT